MSITPQICLGHTIPLKPVIDFLRNTGLGFSNILNFEDGSPNQHTILDKEGAEDTGESGRMVTQTWTYQPKNTEERIRKEKKVQVRNEYIGNTQKCKLLLIYRRARRGGVFFCYKS
jgi:hypothetical protein